MKRILILSVLLSSFAGSALLAQDGTTVFDAGKPPRPTTPPITAPQSPAAVAAITQADITIAKAKEAYEKTVATAKATELAELKQAQAVATKNANLEEANRIDAAIAAAQADEATEKAKKTDPKTELAAKLAGSKWHAIGPIQMSWQLNQNGTFVRSDGRSGTWAAVTGDTIFMMTSDGYSFVSKFGKDLTDFQNIAIKVGTVYHGQRDN